MNLKSLIIVGIILSFAVQDLKLSPHGVTIAERGAPFLYELLILLFCVLTLIRLVIAGPIFNKYLIVYAIFSSLFIINFIVKPDYEYLFGYGSLRMFIFCSLFFISASQYSFNTHDCHKYVYAFVSIALVNSVYTILLYFHIFQPIFPYAHREGMTRYAGFSQSPAYFGPMVATALCLLMPFIQRKGRTLLSRSSLITIFLILLIGLVISMNRSGMVAVVGGFCIYQFLNKRYVQSVFLGLLFLGGIFFISAQIGQGAMIKTLDPRGEGMDVERLRLIMQSIEIALSNPLGIPWGSFAAHSHLKHMAGEPHNLFALMLIYGGVMALILFIYLFFSIMKRYYFNFREMPTHIQAVVIGATGLLIYCQFEITLYQVIALFPLYLFLCCLENIEFEPDTSLKDHSN